MNKVTPNENPLPFLRGNLERKADGTLLAYIPFWRYLFFGLLFVPAFYICIHGLVRLHQELPTGFWKHWDQSTTVVAVVLVLTIGIPVFAYWLLKDGYRKVQFELNGYSVRYLRAGVRGGILFSENYTSILLKDITKVDLRQGLLGGGVITVYTSTQTHSGSLLLSTEEQQLCLQALKEAITIHQRNQV